MKAQFHVAPHQYGDLSVKRIMRELMIGLWVVSLFSLIYGQVSVGWAYTQRWLILLIVAYLGGFLSEALVAKLRHRDIKESYLSSYNWVTSHILFLILPISASAYAMLISSIAASLMGRALFGGFGYTIFNPAGVGRAVFMASFTATGVDALSSATPTTIMANQYHWLQAFDLKTLWFGTYLGSIGETSTILILLVGAWLIYRGVIDWRVPVVYLATLAILGFIVACIVHEGYLWMPLTQIAIGGAAFGAVFMLTDPVTSPVSPAGRVIFAFGAAILTFVVRLAGNLPEGCVLAILLMNMMTPWIDQAMDGWQPAILKKAKIILLVLALVAGGMTVYCANVVSQERIQG